MNYTRTALSIIFVLICTGVGMAQHTAPLASCPRSLAISAPFTINDGDPLTFAVEGAVTPSLSTQLRYTWAVSPASVRVLSGAGTPSITIDTTKLSGKPVTVGLIVEGGDKENPCRVTAEASTTVIAPRAPAPSHKFAEFPSRGFNHDKAKLDQLATFLHNSPTEGAYIIAYSGRVSRPGHANRLGAQARSYLVKSSGIDARWIVAVNGGYRERDTYELWIVPQGARPPQPTPTIQRVPAAEKLPRQAKRWYQER